MKNKFMLFVLIVCACAALAACNQEERPRPKIVSSADMSGYAVTYPARLEERSTTYESERDAAKKEIIAYAAYPDALKEPDFEKAAAVWQRADEVGRSASYAKTMRAEKDAALFFESEKEGMARRVSGAVKTTAEEAQCTCELQVYGRVVYALNQSVNDGLDSRVESANEARRLCDRYARALGKKNTEILSKQADAIAHVSYIVNVELAEIGDDLSALIEEERDVRATLDDALESEREYAAYPDLEKAEKQAAEKRIAELESAKAKIDAAVGRAGPILDGTLEGIPAIRQEHDDALEAIVDRAKDAPPPAAAKPEASK